MGELLEQTHCHLSLRFSGCWQRPARFARAALGASGRRVLDVAKLDQYSGVLFYLGGPCAMIRYEACCTSSAKEQHPLVLMLGGVNCSVQVPALLWAHPCLFGTCLLSGLRI